MLRYGFVFAVALAILWAGVTMSRAQEAVTCENGDLCRVIEIEGRLVGAQIAPPEFDYEPEGPYSVVMVDEETLWRLCRCLEVRRPGLPILGWTDPGASLIYINEKLTGASMGAVIRHEKAHLNGWRH